MIAAVICRQYGWTFEEYENQPARFVDTIIEMLKAESEASEKRAKTTS